MKDKRVRGRGRRDGKKHDWHAHYVFDDKPQSPSGINYHSHGLPELCGHLDIQIVLPLPHRVAHFIAWRIVERIKKGQEFQPGRLYRGIIPRSPVAFALARETGRDVLRVIVADDHGSLDPKRMDPFYRQQYKGTQKP